MVEKETIIISNQKNNKKPSSTPYNLPSEDKPSKSKIKTSYSG